jgi:DnaJ-class molecular chaperone
MRFNLLVVICFSLCFWGCEEDISGYYPEGSLKDCVYCSTKGIHNGGYVNYPSNVTSVCIYCEGTGKGVDTSKCRICSGRGKVTLGKRGDKCRVCHGYGIVATQKKLRK